MKFDQSMKRNCVSVSVSLYYEEKLKKTRPKGKKKCLFVLRKERENSIQSLKSDPIWFANKSLILNFVIILGILKSFWKAGWADPDVVIGITQGSAHSTF